MSALPLSERCDYILQSISEGVFTVDLDFRITSFNRAAERITGYRWQDVIGRTCREVFPSCAGAEKCALKRTVRTGMPVCNWPIQFTNSRGQRIPVSICTSVLKDDDGNTIGGVETLQDLSLVEELRREIGRQDAFVDIIGRSSAMGKLFEVMPAIAASDSTLLIEGASGTGKELFAKAIHNLSRRRDHRFVAVNCSALPDTLLESELFGYKAGAFTDARHDKPGRFAVAEGGTLLLDEIGDISPAMQCRLLRVLQERVFEPLGSVTPVKSDVRIIAATNKDMRTLVAQSKFRDDLFYRLNVVRLRLPELRERRQDIPLLAERFISKFNRLQHKNVAGLSEEALGILMRHDYPGNVRELENMIEHAFVLCSSGLIQPSHLPPELLGEGPADSCPETMTLKNLEALHIADAVRRHHGNRNAAAEELGIDPSTLFRKVKSLGISLQKSRRTRTQKAEARRLQLSAGD
ncbi:MAG: sigma 54-interacting transcriptional regulator [Planctomycetes bacterium]|nr:sigma 54-interacting transcriptional regulator [Planctomycetota bacterium]